MARDLSSVEPARPVVSRPLTAEQECDWHDYIETVWHNILRRANSAAGGLCYSRADMWDAYGASPYLEVEISTDHLKPRENPLIAIDRLEALLREARREVTAAMAAGKFDWRPIGAEEHIAEMREGKS